MATVYLLRVGYTITHSLTHSMMGWGWAGPDRSGELPSLTWLAAINFDFIHSISWQISVFFFFNILCLWKSQNSVGRYSFYPALVMGMGTVVVYFSLPWALSWTANRRPPRIEIDDAYGRWRSYFCNWPFWPFTQHVSCYFGYYIKGPSWCFPIGTRLLFLLESFFSTFFNFLLFINIVFSYDQPKHSILSSILKKKS